MKLAHKINSEIICADSRIIYKNFDIVSAKPKQEECEGIKHHLIDIIDANDEFSAGDFVKLAQEIIEKDSNDYIIISGGTWFYIKSLLDNEALITCSKNNELRQELNKLDKQTLWNKLNELDSKRAQIVHPNNKDKVIRSIEMCMFLNKPVSEQKRTENINYDAIWFAPEITREELYERINKRVDIMLNMGLYEEWKKNKELYPNSKTMENTIGYKEFFELEKGIYDNFDTAVEKIKQHTRNFAKRQLTYFNSNSEIKYIKNLDDILKYI